MTYVEIKSYCEDRLTEIKEINEKFNCPSSFVCIAAFIGYLSRIAYGTNKRSDHNDGKWFRDFVKNFMDQKYHEHADLMYHTFRCGIIHSMSFDDEITCDRGQYLANNRGRTSSDPKLEITHTPKYASKDSQLQEDSNTKSVILYAGELCDDIRKAIGEMFKDTSVQINSVSFVSCQRYIIWKKDDAQDLSNSLSSSY